MIWLTKEINFPDYKYATKEGIIALGGDLSWERLLYAYKNGIFPWFSEDDPIVWYCPSKRMVLFPDELKVSKSMRNIINKNEFIITENKVFEDVIYNCKNIDRNDGLGTWITDDMQQAYINLHNKGIAKSIEVWLDDKLVGGLYGLEINGIFCGESMFSHISNASKIAFVYLANSTNRLPSLQQSFSQLRSERDRKRFVLRDFKRRIVFLVL
jgi:leucyl/phenylalanyl-tRNA--protein transferase